MRPGEATFVVSRACGLLVLAAMLEGCEQDCGWQQPEMVELGVSTDLEDVARVSSGIYLAVGTQGTVVALRQVHDGRHNRWISESFNFTQVDLHAVTSARDEWWVVGDGGFAAVSRDQGESWIEQELGTAADLYAIRDYGDFYAEEGSMIIVGDDVVLLRNPDGSWHEEPPPMGGWGLLRDARPGYGTFVIGLEGVAWASQDPYAPDGSWEAEDTGTSSDLLKMTKENLEGVDEFWAFARDGTNLYYDGAIWQPMDPDLEIVVIDVDERQALAADGTVYEFAPLHDPLPTPVEVPGARALASSRSGGDIAFVGAGGFAAAARYLECPYY